MVYIAVLVLVVNLINSKVLRKHILLGENSSLGFIEAVHYWKWKKPIHWRSLAHKGNSVYNTKIHTHIFNSVYNTKVHTQSMIQEDQKNVNTQWWSTCTCHHTNTKHQANTHIVIFMCIGTPSHWLLQQYTMLIRKNISYIINKM